MNEDGKKSKVFNYTYSSAQQAELREIRRKYLLTKEDKMDQIRRLDARVKRKGIHSALVVGVLGLLLFGIGLGCAMIWKDERMALCVFMVVIGIVDMAAAYPVYVMLMKKEHDRVAPFILKLTDELFPYAHK